MNPLDIKALPRERDVIHLGDKRGTAAASPKLSAELSGRPDPATTILYAIDGAGGVFSLSGSGQHQSIEFSPEHKPSQLCVSAVGNHVWMLARSQRANGTVADGHYSVWRLDDTGGWNRDYDVPACEGRPVIGGARGGFWIACGPRLSLVRDGKAERTEDLDFEPIGVDEGVDGTVWLLGGSKRYGGLEMRRYDERAQRWFLLPPPAAAISMAAYPDGTSWGVSTKGEAWRFSRDGAGTFRECGNDADCRRCFYKPDRSFVRSVSIGSDGNIWFLSGQADGNGYAIERMADLASRETETPNPTLRAVSIAAATRG